MQIVVNEWFLDFHRPDEPEGNRRTVRRFLDWLLESDAQIVLLRESPFTLKLGQLRKAFDYDLFCQLRLKIFYSQILMNPEKCLILEKPTALPAEISSKLKKGNFKSDRYLFESAWLTPEKIIVTTDVKLKNHVGQADGFEVVLLDAFLEQHRIE